MDVSLSLCDIKTECLCMHVRKIYIIDYEYGSYNYQGYGIANHLSLGKVG
jgi:thiamine kinase-like enzyme